MSFRAAFAAGKEWAPVLTAVGGVLAVTYFSGASYQKHKDELKSLRLEIALGEERNRADIERNRAEFADRFMRYAFGAEFEAALQKAQDKQPNHKHGLQEKSKPDIDLTE